jgi:hypothetical protein
MIRFKDYVDAFVDGHIPPEGYLTDNDLDAIK